MVDGNKYTFKEADELSNKVGNYFYEMGFRHGKQFTVNKSSVSTNMNNMSVSLCVFS